MKSKRSINVKLNGKQTNNNFSNKNSNHRFHLLQNKEQAAAVEDTEKGKIHSFARKEPGKVTNFQSINHHPKKEYFLKPVIIAIVSAIVIGSILGIIMLNLFVNLDNGPTNTITGNAPVTNNNTNTKEKAAEKGKATVTLASMNAYVLQAGVFSEESNAKEFASTFENTGFTPFIWSQDGQYFVLTGITNTEEKAKQLAVNFSEQNKEVYVKNWTVEEVETDLTTSEHKWIETFHETWTDSLTAISEQNSIPVKKWNSLLQDYPQQSDKITPIVKGIQADIEQLEDGDVKRSQHLLLNIWALYDTNIGN